MAKATPPRLAILGAGPIGLEAGLYARQAEWPFTIYERGRLAEHVQRWGHVRLFSPFGMNASNVGKSAIKAGKPAVTFPADDALLTGREYVAAYLTLIAELLAPNILTETMVLKVGKRDFLKTDAPGDASRGKSPFRLLVRDKNRERFEEADVVLDCTGTYAQHRWSGAGGIPAPGELQNEAQIAYSLEDILGEKKSHYANKTTLVIGSGYSAANTVCALADLGKEQSSTWGIWIARGNQSAPMRRVANDPLKERDRLAVRANNIALRDDDNVEFHAATVLEAIEPLGQDKGFKVATRGPKGLKALEVDRIIANVGYSPDTNLTRELQIHECYASLGPINLAASLSGNKSTDCLKIANPGPETLRNPEPNFFVLGAKSFGRNSNFLLRLGFEQVRDLFAMIGK